jgi:hypothetical protein
MRLLFLIITILSFSFNAYSQADKCCAQFEDMPQFEKGAKNHPTKEEIMSQKVAFFTQELQLTPQEAEAFWPVYNSGWEKMHNARKEVGRSLKTLNDAIKSEKSEKEINGLMEQYFKACENEVNMQKELYNNLLKVVPTNKAAKVFISEERFRVMLIKRLKKRPMKQD